MAAAPLIRPFLSCGGRRSWDNDIGACLLAGIYVEVWRGIPSEVRITLRTEQRTGAVGLAALIALLPDHCRR
jgi:hypothetical protein